MHSKKKASFLIAMLLFGAQLFLADWFLENPLQWMSPSTIAYFRSGKPKHLSPRGNLITELKVQTQFPKAKKSDLGSDSINIVVVGTSSMKFGLRQLPVTKKLSNQLGTEVSVSIFSSPWQTFLDDLSILEDMPSKNSIFIMGISPYKIFNLSKRDGFFYRTQDSAYGYYREVMRFGNWKSKFLASSFFKIRNWMNLFTNRHGYGQYTSNLHHLSEDGKSQHGFSGLPSETLALEALGYVNQVAKARDIPLVLLEMSVSNRYRKKHKNLFQEYEDTVKYFVALNKIFYIPYSDPKLLIQRHFRKKDDDFHFNKLGRDKYTNNFVKSITQFIKRGYPASGFLLSEHVPATFPSGK